MTRTPRPRANLSNPLHRQLNMYALAATAAGMGTLLSSHAAEAKIVYTPADAVIGFRPYHLDLNHDHKVDFYLATYFRSETGTAYRTLRVCHTAPCHSTALGLNADNQVRGKPGKEVGAAFRAGALIKNGDVFIGEKTRVDLGGVGFPTFANTGTNWYGSWVNGGKGVQNRYLGLKFKIDGKFHFGWARITVKTSKRSFTAKLTGYAYETIPGKAIIAGATKGPDDEPQPAASSIKTGTPAPATLDTLALGAPGLAIWRREESEAAW
jgi:hypothetical protein